MSLSPVMDQFLRLPEGERESLVRDLPPAVAEALLADLDGAGKAAYPAARSPSHLATQLIHAFRERQHLAHISDVVTGAVHDVENGRSRMLILEMPPRSGKTTMATLTTPAWIMQRHPEWPVVLASHDGRLATNWGRQIRRWVEGGSLGPHLQVASDAGAVGSWETTEGGSLTSVSVRESLTGRGARTLHIDDPVKDFVDAHSVRIRNAVWEWWLSVAQTRLEPPYLVIVTMTRWHEDDLVGRLLSDETEGDPADWEVVRLPALADEPADPLGRTEGQPLLSPIINEGPEKATRRWQDTRVGVGEYVWAALYQQHPSPAEGSIFEIPALRYWTSNPDRETADGTVLYVKPENFTDGQWLDSWDTAFAGTQSSDYVVGQRWVRHGADRFLVAQQRGRWAFPATIARMREWGDGKGPYGHLVKRRLVEAKANGQAAIDTLRREITGLTPTNPKDDKPTRGRAVTPEVESGNVYLPHPADPGNEWVRELVSEMREFPNGKHDDQVDALTQALTGLSVAESRSTVTATVI